MSDHDHKHDEHAHAAWEDDGGRPARPCGCVGLGICEHATAEEMASAARQAGRVDPKRRTD